MWFDWLWTIGGLIVLFGMIGLSFKWSWDGLGRGAPKPIGRKTIVIGIFPPRYRVETQFFERSNGGGVP